MNEKIAPEARQHNEDLVRWLGDGETKLERLMDYLGEQMVKYVKPELEAMFEENAAMMGFYGDWMGSLQMALEALAANDREKAIERLQEAKTQIAALRQKMHAPEELRTDDE